MPKWEYKVRDLGRTVLNLASEYVRVELNREGDEGWELITLVHKESVTYALFKRPKRGGLLR